MSQLLTFKIIVVFVACFSAASFANTNNNEPDSPQVTTPTKPAPKHFPKMPGNSRGQLLYENHCIVCHESRAHIREKRKSRSVADIEKWVFRWAQHLKLEWSRAEINDVIQYLNQHFYQFPSTENDAY